MAIDIMQQMQDIKNWKSTRKKNYNVYVCMPTIGTQCKNELEGVEYITDANTPFILSGTVGENWTIDLNKLMRTYKFADGSPINQDTFNKRLNKNKLLDWTMLTTNPDATNVWAFHLPLSIKNFPVQTSW